MSEKVHEPSYLSFIMIADNQADLHRQASFLSLTRCFGCLTSVDGIFFGMIENVYNKKDYYEAYRQSWQVII